MEFRHDPRTRSMANYFRSHGRAIFARKSLLNHFQNCREFTRDRFVFRSTDTKTFEPSATANFQSLEATEISTSKSTNANPRLRIAHLTNERLALATIGPMGNREFSDTRGDRDFGHQSELGHRYSLAEEPKWALHCTDTTVQKKNFREKIDRLTKFAMEGGAVWYRWRAEAEGPKLSAVTVFSSRFRAISRSNFGKSRRTRWTNRVAPTLVGRPITIVAPIRKYPTKIGVNVRRERLEQTKWKDLWRTWRKRCTSFVFFSLSLPYRIYVHAYRKSVVNCVKPIRFRSQKTRQND